MILRSIDLEGWRCFASPIHIGEFTDGLNIVHGPNGIGKTSLMMALARGLFDSHHVGGAEIKTLRSWGRALAPKVTIEFERNGDDFQLHKQFLDSPMAKLARKENGRFVPVAESRAADEKAREILAGEAARGASDQRHWGLAQILWATQGSLKIDQLTAGTRTTIQKALGAQITGPGSAALEHKIAEAHARFFTATGRLKTGASAPAIVGLESQLEKAKSDRVLHQQRLQDFETASRKIEDLRGQTRTARHDEQELDENLAKTRRQVRAYQSLVDELKLHQLEVTATTEQYQVLDERIKATLATTAELTAAMAELKNIKADAPAIEKLVSQKQTEEQLARQQVKHVRDRRSEVTAARQLAQLADRYIRNLEVLHELTKQIKQFESTQDDIRKLRETRQTIVAPDKKTLKKIIQTARRRDDARLELDAGVITVSLQLDSDTKISITSAEEPGDLTVGPGESHSIKGSPDVAFQLEGIGRIQASGPTGDYEQLRARWEEAVAQLAELAAGFGTDDITLLETLHAQADELDSQIKQTDTQLNAVLAGDTIDQIRSEHTLATNAIDEIRRQQPTWKATQPDPANLSRLADNADKNITDEIDQSEHALDRAIKTLQRELQNQSEHHGQATALETRTATLKQRLDSLRNDGLDDEVRQSKLLEIALARDTAQAKLNRVENQIQDLGDDPSKSLTMLEEQQKAYRSDAEQADKKLHTEIGRLDQIVSEAPYAALVAAEEEIAQLETEIGRQQLELDAIRLLHHVVTSQKKDVMQSLIDPIRLRANIILQRIAGARFDNVHFDESLLPTGISPQSSDDAVAIHQISGGEQEQVHFAVRMALAEVAFPNDRQLVVLDDVFTYTDAHRLARIATLLDEAADRFQIVLLTCHPERYRGLPKAKFFDLEQLAKQ